MFGWLALNVEDVLDDVNLHMYFHIYISFLHLTYIWCIYIWYVVVWHVFMCLFSHQSPLFNFGSLFHDRKAFGSPGFYLEIPHPPGAVWWMATSKHVAKPFLQGRQVPQGELQMQKRRRQQRRKQKQLRLTLRCWCFFERLMFFLYNGLFSHATLFCRLHWDDTLFDIMFFDNPFLSGK